MTPVSTCHIITRCAEQTRGLGKRIGQKLQAGVVIRLTGDLGSGKTCFVQGLAAGLEVPPDDVVTSPTYALIHDYPGRLPLVHVDLYRIGDETEAETIGMWDMLDAGTVMAVEWAERIADEIWPPDSLRIDFQTLADETRRIQLIGYGLQIADLIKEVRDLYQCDERSSVTCGSLEMS